ncbi:hypothetical protein M1N91_02940, partial [Dehalococcoidia bacterium]|nr:hypothetical protein [Dehalococcoidia bacterium]
IMKVFQRGKVVDAELEMPQGQKFYLQTHVSKLDMSTPERLRESIARRALELSPPRKVKKGIEGEVEL